MLSEFGECIQFSSETEIMLYGCMRTVGVNLCESANHLVFYDAATMCMVALAMCRMAELRCEALHMPSGGILTN